MKKIILILSLMLLSIESSASVYSFRKYNHVKEFYKDIIDDVVSVSKKYHLPPAALLAIAGLESGYGRGYVSQITGNILSLGAFKGDRELPVLYLPYSKSKQMLIYDPKEIRKTSKNDLSWKKSAKSYKRDYRPLPYAGTKMNLTLLKYNDLLKQRAQKACLNDFATRWISKNSNIKVFKKARIWLDEIVKEQGVDVLFKDNTNQKFIDMIGGHPKSFNHRKTWPKKVKQIMKRVGLVKLTTDIYIKHKKFNQAWRD